MIENSISFFKEYVLSGDGSGFFDAYEKKELWGNRRIDIRIVYRRLAKDTPLCLKKILENQNHNDHEWKDFIASKLLNELKIEWDTIELSFEQIVDELEIVDISYGYYDAPYDFNIYFIAKNIDSEHGIVLLCDKHGKPIKTHIE